jgi:hypothetical protein
MDRREFVEASFGLVTTAILGGKPEKIEEEPKKYVAILIEADKPNKNGRVYPLHVLKKAVEESNQGEILGHLDMPEDGKVHLQDVSHMCHNFEIKDGFFQCEIEILDTPKGKILKNIINDVEFRTVGIGNLLKVNEDEILVIDDNYKLTCVNAIEQGTGA